MYFNLPKSDQRANNENVNNSSNSNKKNEYTSDERMCEIRDNVEDHWGSPNLLTPGTLSYILDNQWVSEENGSSTSNNKRVKRKNEAIQNLIKELYKTIETIDSEHAHRITKELNNDSVLQQVRNAEKPLADEKTLEHLVNLLKDCNNK